MVSQNFNDIMFLLHTIHLGPDHDKIRHDIGVEYERLLEELLGSMSKSLNYHFGSRRPFLFRL